MTVWTAIVTSQVFAITLRILLSIGLGALIGLERQLRARSAGIRTNALVSLGSCLFTTVGVYTLANMMLRPIGAAIDARRTAQSHEAEGIRYTLEVKCLRKDEQAIRALVFNALHQPGFIVQSIAASDLPDDLVVITTVVATHMSSNIDIESSIETVTTPEVLGVKWDAEQITAVD